MASACVRNFLKEQFLFILISFVAFNTQPAILYAKAQDYNPAVFIEPLSLSRGNLSPGSLDGMFFSESDYCKIMLEDWGWDSCEGVDAVVIGHVPNADTTVIFKPDSSGFVKFDDWNSSDRTEEISQIEASLSDSLAAQSKRTGDRIEFAGWQTYPTLNQDKHYLYYSINLIWNGEPQTNIKATVFDRRGYTVFDIVPDRSGLSKSEMESLINASLDRYAPAPQQEYAAFQNGDKVAAVGALGVLATLVGVKYGKTLVATLLAIALVMAKKGAVLVLIPILWIGKLFRRKTPGSTPPPSLE